MKILTLNIENPSIERVNRIIRWIEHRSEDVFIFTETKNSRGCNKLETYFRLTIGDLFFRGPKYYVLFPKPIDNNYGVMCISKYPIELESTPFFENSPFYSRYLNFRMEFSENIIRILGLYVPSRNQTEEKILRKQSFLTQVIEEINKEKNNIDVI